MKKGIGSILEQSEALLGKFFTALLSCFVLLLIAVLYGAPIWEPIFHGETFCKMSEMPWKLSPDIALQYRILSPVLGYFLFLRGANFIWFMLVVALLFLCLVYLLSRKNGLNPLESLGVSALMALSTPILFVLHYPGYTDLTTYVFIVLIIMYKNKKWLGVALTGVAFFNHEIIFFLIPWIAFLLNGNTFKTKYFETIGILLLISIPYIFFRFYVSTRIDVKYDMGYYFNLDNISWTLKNTRKLFLLGFFEAFKLFWLLPVLALINERKQKRNSLLITSILIIGGTLLQLTIASDTSRLVGLAFPLILFSAYTMKEKWGAAFAKRLWLLILINLFIPSCYIGQEYIIPFPPYIFQLLSSIF